MTLKCAIQVRPFDDIDDGEHLAVVWLNNDAPALSRPSAWRTVWNGARARVCTDGAADHLRPLCAKARLLQPTLVCGDFDSITAASLDYFRQRTLVVHTPDQQFTDLCKALNLIRELDDFKCGQIRSVLLLGGQAGRFDHAQSNLGSMLRFGRATAFACPIYQVDSVNLIYVVGPATVLSLDRRRLTGTCGVMPLVQEETVVTTTGLKWNLTNTKMEYGGLVSSCNKLESDQVQIDSNVPVLFTCELKTVDSFAPAT